MAMNIMEKIELNNNNLKVKFHRLNILSLIINENLLFCYLKKLFSAILNIKLI